MSKLHILHAKRLVKTVMHPKVQANGIMHDSQLFNKIDDIVLYLF